MVNVVPTFFLCNSSRDLDSNQEMRGGGMGGGEEGGSATTFERSRAGEGEMLVLL